MIRSFARCTYSQREEKQTDWKSVLRDTDLCIAEGLHTPSRSVTPDAKTSPVVFPPLAPSPLPRLSFSLSFSFPTLSVRTTDSPLPAPLLGLNPIIAKRRSSASGEWSSGGRHECVSLVRLVIHSQARLATAGCTPRFGCTQLHTLRTDTHSISTHRARTSQQTGTVSSREHGIGYGRIRKRSAVLIRHAHRFSALKGKQDEGDRASAGWTMRQPDRREGKSMVNC